MSEHQNMGREGMRREREPTYIRNWFFAGEGKYLGSNVNVDGGSGGAYAGGSGGEKAGVEITDIPLWDLVRETIDERVVDAEYTDVGLAVDPTPSTCNGVVVFASNALFRHTNLIAAAAAGSWIDAAADGDKRATLRRMNFIAAAAAGAGNSSALGVAACCWSSAPADVSGSASESANSLRTMPGKVSARRSERACGAVAVASIARRGEVAA